MSSTTNSGTARPPGHATQEKMRDALVSLSLANLCFTPVWIAFLHHRHSLAYYNKCEVTSTCLAALVCNVGCLSAAFWCGLRGLRCWQNRWLRLVGCGVVLAALCLPLNFVRGAVLHIEDAQAFAMAKSPLCLFGLVLVLVIIAVWPRLSARVLYVFLLIVSPLGILTLGRILLLALATWMRPPQQSPSAPPLCAKVPAQRVVMIVFDEMDQRVAFTERPASLRLPEFDRLRSESIYADQAYPPATTTTLALPSLIAGHYVTNVSIDGPSDMSLALAGVNGMVKWSATPTIFSRAREMGCNTALVGWFHPYERIFGSALNFCQWYPYPDYSLGRDATFHACLVDQIWSSLPDLSERRKFIYMCRDSLKNASPLASNTNYNVVFLHLPPPHKPGVYRPEVDDYTVVPIPQPRGYLNNTVLADRMLGSLRRDMESAGAWDRSWVVVISDHSWRTPEAMYPKPDRRVPFMLKAPGQRRARSYAAYLNTVVLHDLTLAILRNEIATDAAAVSWLEAHPQPPSPGYSD